MYFCNSGVFICLKLKMGFVSLLYGELDIREESFAANVLTSDCPLLYDLFTVSK